MKIVEIFESVPDFRNSKFVSYKLSEVLVISLCAVISGADDCEEIAEYAVEKAEFLGQFLELPNGTPSHDTFNRIFRNMDIKSFERCLINRSKEILSALDHHQINVDGKVLRATGERGKKTAAICIVSAWVSEECLCLGQSKVSKKSNEKTAIPEIIEAVDIKGGLVSIDAMGCDKKIASLIRENEGDYLLALKKNQKGLYEEVHDWLLNHKASLDCYEYTDYVGGRIEQRKCYVSNDLSYIDEALQWRDSKSIIMVESERTFKGGKKETTFQRRFYISSMSQDAVFFERSVRKHWSIENQLHWYLDVVFNEDRQRVREGNGAENMALLRKMALQTLLKNKGRKSLKTIRKKVAWNEKLLIHVLKDF